MIAMTNHDAANGTPLDDIATLCLIALQPTGWMPIAHDSEIDPWIEFRRPVVAGDDAAWIGWEVSEGLPALVDLVRDIKDGVHDRRRPA